MLWIRYQGVVAVWDDDSLRWHVTDETRTTVEVLLNTTVPASVYEASAPFLEKGTQGLALEAVRKELGEIEVVKETEPPEAPDDEDDKDY